MIKLTPRFLLSLDRLQKKLQKEEKKDNKAVEAALKTSNAQAKKEEKAAKVSSILASVDPDEDCRLTRLGTMDRLKRKLERLLTSTPTKKRKLLASLSRLKRTTTRVSLPSTSTRTISLYVHFPAPKSANVVIDGPLRSPLFLQLREQERQRLVAERNPKLAALQEQQAMKKEHDVSRPYKLLRLYID